MNIHAYFENLRKKLFATELKFTNEIKRKLHMAKKKKKEKTNEETVNHPPHYQGQKFEVIDVIEDFDLNFRTGNALKYLMRAGRKYQDNDGYLEDLYKAIWYLEREIEYVNQGAK